MFGRHTLSLRATLLLAGLALAGALALCSAEANRSRSIARSSDWAAGREAAGPNQATRSRIHATFGKLPLYFIENRGQVDSRVSYCVQGRDTLPLVPPARAAVMQSMAAPAGLVRLAREFRESHVRGGP
jgi:hypothetical protein